METVRFFWKAKKADKDNDNDKDNDMDMDKDTDYGKGKSQRKRGYFGFAPQKLRCGSADSVTPYAPRETEVEIRNSECGIRNEEGGAQGDGVCEILLPRSLDFTAFWRTFEIFVKKCEKKSIF